MNSQTLSNQNWYNYTNNNWFATTANTNINEQLKQQAPLYGKITNSINFLSNEKPPIIYQQQTNQKLFDNNNIQQKQQSTEIFDKQKNQIDSKNKIYKGINDYTHIGNDAINKQTQQNQQNQQIHEKKKGGTKNEKIMECDKEFSDCSDDFLDSLKIKKNDINDIQNNNKKGGTINEFSECSDDFLDHLKKKKNL